MAGVEVAFTMQGIHFDRIAGGYRDHSDPRRHVAAGFSSGQGQGTKDAMSVELETANPRQHALRG